MMNRRMELDLMRLLHGDLPEERARELRARMERDPELAEELGRLRRTWEGLSLPPRIPVPAGFSQRVLARARSEKTSGLSWSSGLSWRSAPGWVRATAAAALIAGTAFGVGVGGAWPLAEPSPPSSQGTSAIDGSLAESYWLAMEDLDDAGGSGAGGSDEALP